MATILDRPAPARAAPPAAAAPARLALEGALVLALALLLPGLWLGAGAHFDELYHVLAAKGVLATGAPAIADGVYERGYLFTLIVAKTFELVGPSLEAARLPSLLFFAVAATLLFLWVRAAAGALAGSIVTALLLLSPLALDIGYMARFYALHTLAFLVAAFCLWRLGSGDDRMPVRLALAATGAAAAWLALDLHVLTLVHLAGAGLWLALAVALRLIRAGRIGLVVAAGTALLATVGLGLVFLGDRLMPLVEQYRWAPAWAADTQNQMHYYHLRLMVTYPLFWALTPIAAYLAFARNPAFTTFALLTFGTAFLVLSFGGMKTDRYLFGPALFLFAVWGMGGAAAWPRVRRGAWALAGRVQDTLRLPLPRDLVRVGLIGAAVLFGFAASGEPFRAARAILSGTIPHSPGRNVVAADWPAAAGPLAPWLNDADVVVTTDELSALHFLGRADLVISRTRLSEIGDGTDFTPDPRTGLPVIQSATALERTVACHRRGLVVIPAFDFDAEWTVPAPTRAAVLATTEPLPLEALPGLRLFAWTHATMDRNRCALEPDAEGRLHPTLIGRRLDPAKEAGARTLAANHPEARP